MNKTALRFLIAAFAAIALFSCVSTPPKEGSSIAKGKMVVIGRLEPGLDLNQFFNVKKKSDLVLRFAWNTLPPETATGATCVNNVSMSDDYFMVIMPAVPSIHLSDINYAPIVSVGDQTQLDLDFEDLLVTVPDSAQLVYIGDLKLRFPKDSDPKLRIDDGYQAALKAFGNYYKDGKGGYLKPAKAIATGSLKLDVTRITQSTYLIWQ
jgi:hypothetical protein